MKKYFATLCLSIGLSTIAVPATLHLAATPAQAQAARSGWKTVTGPGFSIQMPGNAKTKQETIVMGKDRMPAQGYTSQSGDNTYGVMVMDTPVTIDPKSDVAQQALDHMGPGLAQLMETRLVGKQSFALKGNPGREFIMKDKTGRGKVRVFLVNNRVYMLMAGGNGNVNDQAINTFLQSFKLTDK